MDWDAVAGLVWGYLDPNTEFPWPKSKAERDRILRKLSQIIPQEDLEVAYPYHDKILANQNIRKIISPYLRGQDRVLSAELAVWIVREWGGIKRGSEECRVWSEELGDYSRRSIDEFTARLGNQRISSWSKLLAFAAPETEAIYDARTAVAINCALYAANITAGFYMPSGRNPNVVPAYKKLKIFGFKQAYGYADYIKLLNSIKAHAGKESILQIEMALFANAPAVARKFVSQLG